MHMLHANIIQLWQLMGTLAIVCLLALDHCVCLCTRTYMEPMELLTGFALPILMSIFAV